MAPVFPGKAASSINYSPERLQIRDGIDQNKKRKTDLDRSKTVLIRRIETMPRVIVDVNITPVGTDQTSISGYIAASEKALGKHTDLKVQINPMSTTIEGELDRVLEALREMHEAPFQAGAQRVSTSIRIDDRRDSFESLEDRVKVVQEKMRS
jgi:uncharacterized protein (TIGR00106 family)